jgi:hypothetical protein
MTRKGARKGRTVTPPDSWFAALEEYKRTHRKSLEALGHDLAVIFGEPVPISTVHDYLRRRKGVTEEMTIALAKVTGLPMPPLGEGSADPEIAEWADLGRQLKAEVPERFRHDLAALRDLVAALKRHRLR